MKAYEFPIEAHPAAYSFGDIVVERHKHQLLKAGQARSIEPRAFDVMIFLIEGRDRVVEKQELFDRVWKQSFVTDSALGQEIKNLRRAIGDDANAPRYIETVHKHGYRFIADVIEIPATRDVEEKTPASAIAVLPFVNLSGDPDNEYFCDGLSEELIDRLTKLQTLRVVARTSSFSFKGKETDVREIGRRLNAGTILEGSVRRQGDRLRVSVQIVDASNGYHISSESYDRRWDDLFAMQDEIALAVLDKLKLQLFPEDEKAVVKRNTDNVEAYHLHRKGRYFWNQRLVPGAMQKAIEFFQQAIKADPQYALAYTGLADAYSTVGFYGLKPPKEIFPLAKTMVERAFAIRSDLAEALTSQAIISLVYDWDYAAAERAFKSALELNRAYPLAHQWYSYCLIITGRTAEALAEIDQALNLDPLSPNVNAAAGQLRCYARQYDAAVEQLQKTIELEPRFSFTYFYLAEAYFMQEKYEEALQALRKAVEVSSAFPWASSYMSIVHAMAGERDKAMEVLRRSERQAPNPVIIAGGYYRLGEPDKAFEWLERGYEEREFLMPWLNILPESDVFRPDPRWPELIRRLGLTP